MKYRLSPLLFLFCLNGYAHDIGSCLSSLIEFNNHYAKYPKEGILEIPSFKCDNSVEDCSHKMGSYQLENKISALPYNNGIILYPTSLASAGLSSFVKFPPLQEKEHEVFKFSIENKIYCGEASKLGTKNSYSFHFTTLATCGSRIPLISINSQDEATNNLAVSYLQELLEKSFNELEKDNFKDNPKVDDFSKILSVCRNKVPQSGEVNDVSPIKHIINKMIEKINTRLPESSNGNGGTVTPK